MLKLQRRRIIASLVVIAAVVGIGTVVAAAVLPIAPLPCSPCNGSGKITHATCNGTGKKIGGLPCGGCQNGSNACAACGGSGRYRPRR